MMDWKKLLRKLLFPPIWVMILLTIFSTAALVEVFTKDLTTNLIAYVIYVVSFYTVSVLFIFGGITLPKCYKK